MMVAAGVVCFLFVVILAAAKQSPLAAVDPVLLTSSKNTKEGESRNKKRTRRKWTRKKTS